MTQHFFMGGEAPEGYINIKATRSGLKNLVAGKKFSFFNFLAGIHQITIQSNYMAVTLSPINICHSQMLGSSMGNLL